jgi:Fe-S oxidoreductase
MAPLPMALLLLVAFGVFGWSAWRRWRLMRVARAPDCRGDRIGERVQAVAKYMFGQWRMLRYPWAGLAHVLVFFGFMVLLLNSLILWGRGFVADFDGWVFGLDQPLGVVYALLRDVFTVLVILGVLVFAWNRLVLRLSRLTLNVEGLLILGIIFTMMVADLVYEGGELLHRQRAGVTATATHPAMPAATATAAVLSGLAPGAQDALWHVGFWVHSVLVLLFLNLLPYGKHFHVITVLPNVFCRDLTPRGRLRPIADIDGRLERGESLGAPSVRALSWKSVLDFYTCTECGRCSDHCPATSTGKRLSPKHLTIDLRDHMYRRERELLAPGDGAAERDVLVPGTIAPEVLWACTTCAACEQECPVFISYIDKIVDLRRHLVMECGEFPEQLQTMLRGLETVGNPYSIPNDQRADWAAGLDVPLLRDQPDAELLYWVGCAAAFDDRAKRVAQALAKLLRHAGVRFAILGPEETCNGDPARRAGNEYLFQMLARANVEVLNGYGVKRIVTACPHCYNTLKHEYPDFGGHFEVVHHTELLADLVRAGRLRPTHAVTTTAAFHDACYLGRHNGVYDAPRDVLAAIPGVRLVEPAASRDRGLCCGAGGAQMWKEEEAGRTRINHERTRQLLTVLPAGDGPRTIASACPFCKTMLTDGLADQGHTDVPQQDVAELLLAAVEGPPAAPTA